MLPSRQFQALLHSRFQVLCIFPSRYLSAIGLSPLLSFGRRVPPPLRCTPKQRDSPNARRTRTTKTDLIRDSHPLRCPVPGDLGLPAALTTRLQHTTLKHHSSCRDSKGELSPLHSPLLEGSSLVSFPRLNNMLKFGRFPRLCEIGRRKQALGADGRSPEAPRACACACARSVSAEAHTASCAVQHHTQTHHTHTHTNKN